MELIKTGESVIRNFDGEKSTEEITSLNYKIVENGAVIGYAGISNNNFNLNVTIPGTMDELKAKVESMFA